MHIDYFRHRKLCGTCSSSEPPETLNKKVGDLLTQLTTQNGEVSTSLDWQRSYLHSSELFASDASFDSCALSVLDFKYGWPFLWKLISRRYLRIMIELVLV